jgi:hypothetical protein
MTPVAIGAQRLSEARIIPASSGEDDRKQGRKPGGEREPCAQPSHGLGAPSTSMIDLNASFTSADTYDPPPAPSDVDPPTWVPTLDTAASTYEGGTASRVEH